MRTLRATIHAALACVFLAAGTFAADYFIATSGDDTNDGSSGAPFATIQKAVDLAKPGDVITVRTGTYNQTIIFWSANSGTADNPIVIKGESRAGVIIDGEFDTTMRHLFASWGASYVTLEDMTFRRGACFFNNSQVRIAGGSRGWTVRNILTKESHWDGIVLEDVDHCLVEDVITEYNFAGGIGGGKCRDVVVRNCISRNNNCGWDYNPFPEKEGSFHNIGGKYHVPGGFSGGGGKWCNNYEGPLLIENHQAYDNHGPGLWFDWDNRNVVVRNSEFRNNKGMAYNWEGSGVFWEVNPTGPLTLEYCYSHDNDGSEIAVCESKNVTIMHTLINGSFELRDMEREAPVRDGEPALNSDIENLTLKHNVYQNGEIRTSLGAETWTTSMASTRSFDWDYNTWEGSEPTVTWGPNSRTGLASIQSDFNVELNSTHSGSISSSWETGDPEPPVFTSMTVTPAGRTLLYGETLQLWATARDQYFLAMPTQPAFTWSATGADGEVDNDGMFTAGNTEGTVTVTADASMDGTAKSASTQIEIVAKRKATGHFISEGEPLDFCEGPWAAFDGDITTYPDCHEADELWAGFRFDQPKTIVEISFCPRDGFGERMVGRTFEVSANGTDWTSIYTIESVPADGEMTTVTIDDPLEAAYVRYNSNAGGECGYLNVAEIEFYEGPSSGNAVALSPVLLRTAMPLHVSAVAGRALVNVAAEGAHRVDLFSLNGRLVHRVRGSGSRRYLVNRTMVPTGYYLVSVAAGAYTVCRRVMICR
ncbi:MAG: DUF1565 domain-containing protein [Chitinivibrionales bacterium]|nr:DUF1565 domain-containing protein [Chitinivibrionales bacterium]MBD3396603.1 DUF1565 domain-containing protein [Chitinivibrionales bacterium]